MWCVLQVCVVRPFHVRCTQHEVRNGKRKIPNRNVLWPLALLPAVMVSHQTICFMQNTEPPAFMNSLVSISTGTKSCARRRSVVVSQPS